MSDPEKEKTKKLIKDLERKIDEHDNYEFEKHIKFNQYQNNIIERSAHDDKCSEAEIIRKSVVFRGENFTKKVHRDDELHPTRAWCDETCEQCKQVIPAREVCFFNKNYGYVCQNCDASLGSAVLVKKKLALMKYVRAISVARARFEDLMLKIEGVDNKKTIHEILLQMEQNQQSRNESAKNLILVLKDFSQFSDFDAKAFLEKIASDEKQAHDKLVSLIEKLIILERTASDQIAFAKRRKMRTVASVDDMDAEDVITEDVGDAYVEDPESLTKENL